MALGIALYFLPQGSETPSPPQAGPCTPPWRPQGYLGGSRALSNCGNRRFDLLATYLALNLTLLSLEHGKMWRWGRQPLLTIHADHESYYEPVAIESDVKFSSLSIQLLVIAGISTSCVTSRAFASLLTNHPFRGPIVYLGILKIYMHVW